MSNFVNLLDIIYPVNSIYITASGISPATSIGGTWTQITGGACLAAYDNIVGYTGSKTISERQMPEHKHVMNMYTTRNEKVGCGLNVVTYFEDRVFVTSALDYTKETTNNTGGGQDYYPYSYACKVWIRTA